MAPDRIEFLGGRIAIYLEETYFVHYWYELREMTAKQLETYHRIQKWPQAYMVPGLLKMNPADHPRIMPLTGRQICEKMEQGFIPQFDPDFLKSKKIMLVHAAAIEAFRRQKAARQAQGR